MPSDSGNGDPNGLFRRLSGPEPPGWQSPPAPPLDAVYPSQPTIPAAATFDPTPAPAAPARSRGRTVALAGVLGGTLALSAIGGGAWFAWNALLGHEDRATAEYAPAGSLAYAALNTDPTSRAWLDAWELGRRLGIEDDLRALPDRLEEDTGDDGIWDEVIRPAVGHEIGFAVWQDSAADGAEPHVALIVMTGDRAKAEQAIAEIMQDAPATPGSYRDAGYQTGEDGQVAGIVDEALVVTESVAAFEDVVDAHLDGALADDGGFDAAAGRAADDPLLFVYLDGAGTADALAAIDDGLSGELPGDVVAPMMLGGMAGGIDDAIEQWRALGDATVTVKADGDALRVESLTSGRPASFPTAAAGDRYAAELPASTLVYAAGSNLYATLVQPMLAQLDAFEEAMGSAEMAPSLDDLETTLGFDLEQDLLAHLDGSWAIGIDGRMTEAEPGVAGAFHLFSATSDPAAVGASIDALGDMLEQQGAPIVREDGSVAFGMQGVQAAMAVEQDTFRLEASYDAEDAGGSLAEDADFQRATAGLADDASLTGYVALQRIAGLVPDDAWSAGDAEARAALEALGPLAWALSSDGEGTRGELVLFIDGD